MDESEPIVGKNIFETYPARSLGLLKLPDKMYKGHKISFQNGHWTGGVAAEIAEGLGLIAKNGDTLNDDELDAIICALAGVVDDDLILQGDELKHEISKSIKNKLKNGNIECLDLDPPLGYVLIKERLDMKIIIEMKKFDDHESMMKEIFVM